MPTIDEAARTAAETQTAEAPRTPKPPRNAGSPRNAAPPRDPARTPGWREVLIVAAIVVAVVLGAAFLTGVLPTAEQNVVFKTPLAIIVIGVGTIGLLAWLARRPAS